MKVFAHRGNGIPECKENTLEAFKQVQSLNIDGIELDTHFTKDGQWIINHDFMMYGSFISKTNSDKLEKLASEKDEKIIYLKEALNIIKTELNVECKTNSDIAGYELAKFLNENAKQEYFISSFKFRSLKGARRYSDTIRLSHISAIPNPWQWKKYHNQIKLYSINPLHTFLVDRLIDYINNLGVKIHPWTVNDPNKVMELRDKKIDAIITDTPNSIIPLL